MSPPEEWYLSSREGQPAEVWYSPTLLHLSSGTVLCWHMEEEVMLWIYKPGFSQCFTFVTRPTHCTFIARVQTDVNNALHLDTLHNGTGMKTVLMSEQLFAKCIQPVGFILLWRHRHNKWQKRGEYLRDILWDPCFWNRWDWRALSRRLRSLSQSAFKKNSDDLSDFCCQTLKCFLAIFLNFYFGLNSNKGLPCWQVRQV